MENHQYTQEPEVTNQVPQAKSTQHFDADFSVQNVSTPHLTSYTVSKIHGAHQVSADLHSEGDFQRVVLDRSSDTESKTVLNVEKRKSEIRDFILGVFDFRFEPVLIRLQNQGLISNVDIDPLSEQKLSEEKRKEILAALSDEELSVLNERALLKNRITADANLSMLFGRASTAGLVRDSCIGSWNDKEIEKITEIVDDFDFSEGRGDLYDQVRKKCDDKMKRILGS